MESNFYVCALAALEKDHDSPVDNAHKLNLAPCMIQANSEQQAQFKALRTARTIFPPDNGYFGHNATVVKAEESIADVDDPNFQVVQHQVDSLEVIDPDSM